MEENGLIVNIQSGELSIQNISKEDFKMLLTTPETKSYALLLCGRAYFMSMLQNLQCCSANILQNLS